MNDIIKPNQGKDVLAQAQESRVREKVAKLKKLSEEIANIIKPMIIDSGIEVGDYETMKIGITGTLDVWFNEEINSKKLSDVVSPVKENK